MIFCLRVKCFFLIFFLLFEIFCHEARWQTHTDIFKCRRENKRNNQTNSRRLESRYFTDRQTWCVEATLNTACNKMCCKHTLCVHVYAGESVQVSRQFQKVRNGANEQNKAVMWQRRRSSLSKTRFDAKCSFPSWSFRSGFVFFRPILNRAAIMAF